MSGEYVTKFCCIEGMDFAVTFWSLLFSCEGHFYDTYTTHYYYYYYYYLLQLSCQSVEVGLTLVQTKQIRIDIHRRNNTKTQYEQYKNTVQTIQKHGTNNTKTQYKQYKSTVQTIQKHSTNNT